VNADEILRAFEEHRVEFILIGGMNFAFRHKPVLTYDLDLWIRDTDENLARTARALLSIGAEWGQNDQSWSPVPAGCEWLRRQSIYCLTTKLGAVDIFREVKGLEDDFDGCRRRAMNGRTAAGTSFLGLSDEDMLRCQLALPAGQQNAERIAYLRSHLESNP
jgi:hypothetical protein